MSEAPCCCGKACARDEICLPVVVERMELGLRFDELFSGSLHRDEVGQVELEIKYRLLSGLPFKLFDHRL